MVSAVVSWSSGLGSSSDRWHYVVLFGKTLLLQYSASLHPGVQMGTGKYNAGGNPVTD